MFTEVVSVVALGWYFIIVVVCTIGYIQLFTHYRSIPRKAACLFEAAKDLPHITVIRPCKGLEPFLYECLTSTFQQDYPSDKISIYFCVNSRKDSAFSIIERVFKDNPDRDAQIFVEEEDPVLNPGPRSDSTGHKDALGPNPKIRNMSRAYREGKGDIIWIIDCNVWVGRGTAARMVDRLCGFSHAGPVRPFKLVHLAPICVDVGEAEQKDSQANEHVISSYDDAGLTQPLLNLETAKEDSMLSLVNQYGGRLEELFLSSSHAKMYVAINTVAIAPCIVGKSTMFRRSHLNFLTQALSNQDETLSQGVGIDYFSQNICEDHLFGDMLWKSSNLSLPTEASPTPQKLRNHGLVYGDFAIQPVSGMSVANYIARRVRWLRVRKFTVPAATLVEPGTESFLCSLYGAFGVTTSQYTRHWFGASWTIFVILWLTSIILWAAVDWTVYLLLHSGLTIETDSDTNTATALPSAAAASSRQPQPHSNVTSRTSSRATSPLPPPQNQSLLSSTPPTSSLPSSQIPSFARPRSQTNPFLTPRRAFKLWLFAWLGRESLAFPIWFWAIWGGVTVTWRDRKFWVGLDMKVHEIEEEKGKEE